MTVSILRIYDSVDQCSVQFSSVTVSLRPQRLPHARLPCPSPTPGTCSNSYPSSQWCQPTISTNVKGYIKKKKMYFKQAPLVIFIQVVTYQKFRNTGTRWYLILEHKRVFESSVPKGYIFPSVLLFKRKLNLNWISKIVE